MKKSIKPRLIALALASSLSLAGCGNDIVKAEVVNFEEVEQEDYEVSIEIKETEPALCNMQEDASVQETIPETKEKDPMDEIVNIDVVMGTAQVNIRKAPIESSDRLSVLAKNDILEYVGEVSNWYIVKWHDTNCYVSKDYAVKTQVQRINLPIQKVVIFTADKDIETTTEKVKVPKYECGVVYYEKDDKYLVQTNDYIGYITKDNTSDLEGTYAIVDISDQEIRVYKDNECIYYSPVVTGRNNATHIGEFEIYHISTSRYLVGPNYRSYVDYMLKFDGNIGLHDAEYHTDDNGRSHGWRDFSEFGGDTYLTDGSHGCVNLPHDTAQFVYENMTYNDKVIVKK